MRQRPPIESTAGKNPLGAVGSLRLHWPEYLMEAAEAGLYLFAVCLAATLLWHPASPLQRYLASDAVRRMLMGSAMGATVMAIVLSPWGKQSGAHFNPAVTFTFYWLGKVMAWDAIFYGAAQLSGAVGGVAFAALLLHGAPAHHAVRYAVTMPGIYGDPIAFVAELVISFILMSAILFASNHEVLSPYTHHFAAILVSAYIAFESPVSGMSTSPAPHIRPRVVRQILARPMDLFHRATAGHADGWGGFSSDPRRGPSVLREAPSSQQQALHLPTLRSRYAPMREKRMTSVGVSKPLGPAAEALYSGVDAAAGSNVGRACQRCDQLIRANR
jgi:aquaporin Z